MGDAKEIVKWKSKDNPHEKAKLFNNDHNIKNSMFVSLILIKSYII